MLQTALLEPFLVPKTEEQNREETVKDCIEKIRPIGENFVRLTEYKNKSFFQKIKKLFTSIDIWIPILTIVLFSLNISDDSSKLIKNFLSLLIIALMVYWSGVIFETNGYHEDELIANEEENKKNIISLFSALSDKKFEIRGELLENYSKLKLIIEENQYIEGTTSVIKNSSKSLTAYINMTEDKESIIRSVVSIVKESEKKFN